MNKFEMIKKCEEHFDYWDIVKSETQEIIDYAKIVEYIYLEIGKHFLKGLAKENIEQ